MTRRALATLGLMLALSAGGALAEGTHATPKMGTVTAVRETEIVEVDPDDPASQAIRHAARGLIALAPVKPIDLPVLDVVQAGPPQPVGMSLPMA